MARFLADTLAALNIVLAIIIVIAGALVGHRWAYTVGENLTFGTGIGLVAGLLIAAVVCGLLAMLALIENHLRLIADDIEEMRARDAAGK